MHRGFQTPHNPDRLEFASPVTSQHKTWAKTDCALRLADKEARENVAASLRMKGITVTAE